MTSSRRMALAAPQLDAVEAAREIASVGGNAVDAAVAAAAVLAVVYPHMCSAGGDMIALVRTPDGEEIVVNASGAYGSARDVDELFADAAAMPIVGERTVSVPGAVSGWAALLERWGSLPPAQVLAPAIRLASEGMLVAPGLADALEEDAEALAADPGIRSVFFPGGRPAPVGALVRQPELARTLHGLATDGLESFYAGPTALRLVDGLSALGVPIRAEDLLAHRVSLEEPLRGTFGPFTVSTAGPNSQGFSLLRTLGALEAIGHARADVEADVLAELLLSADRLRDAELADPHVVPVDVAGMLDSRALRAAGESAIAAARGGERRDSIATARPAGDTVAVCAVDAEGLTVSLIQSVFHSFGAQLLEPSTGLVLHNRAAFFSLDPSSPNRVAVGKRPAHTLMPVLVTHSDGTIAAHGTMGGKAQAQIHAQLILRVLEGATPLGAVTAPRFVVGGMDAGSSDDRVFAEADLEPERLELLRRGSMALVVGERGDASAGHSMIARRTPGGVLSAGADPRSDGGVLLL
ncbi:gamma-glutamyltransferase family protein [Naasia lichenicola]|uniref:Gamma-glutamyltranspeptidase n=1 Tax=Naasia lichenicola TaxID=2565933 RepID=A0A4S4FSN0_9MICO|nr:gamma-glutamyltransferase [Naasia lichenicola]THG33414.1 hypothetical protein E6C64_03465 [Naasia lichenicola]